MIAVTGCGNKTALSSKDFKTKMEDKSFTVQDATTQMEQYSYINKVYLAISSDSSYQIEFYELEDNDYASSFFNINKENFENSKSSSAVETSVNLSNHSKYTLTTNGKFKVISRIENTVIYVDVDENYKSSVQDILDDLDY